MQKTAARLLEFVPIVLISILALSGQVSAAPGTQSIIMSNMYIYAELGTDCSSTILIQTNVTNVGTGDLNSFEMRIDVRGLQIMSARLNGIAVNTSVNSVDNYVIVTVLTGTPIPSGLSAILNLNFTAQCLQERTGLTSDGSMYINNLIYYLRPFNEIHNLTFSAALPPHSILYLDAAAPLFPSATSNHTDGVRTIYVWKTESLLPGQETVYIVKYLIPAVLIDSTVATTDGLLMVGIVSAIGAAAAVLVVERIPGWIRRLTTKQVIVSGKISSQEQEILDLLTSRGGSCPQREIYENLDMSQAMASMMLSSLEERGLIKRLRSGRENIVHIMEN